MIAPTPVAQSLWDKDVPLTEVVEQLNNHVLANESEKDGILWDLWNDVMDIAAKTPPGEQDRLVEFMKSLQKCDVRSAAGEPVAGDDGALWGDLPRFGWAAREAWNWDPHDPSATEEECKKWVNMTTFLARLTSNLPTIGDREANHPFDYSLYALWALRSAFEEDPPDSASNIPAVRNAALWILHAGPMLRKLSAEGVAMHARSGIAGPKVRDKKWKGFNDERWRLWRDGFEQAGDVEEARAAAEVMHSLD